MPAAAALVLGMVVCQTEGAIAHPPHSGDRYHSAEFRRAPHPADAGIAAPNVPRPFAPPSRIGRWSAPREVDVIGIHAALLHTGEVLLFQGKSSGSRGSRARLLDPRTGQLKTVNIPFRVEHFCSGHVQLPDGKLLVAGGEGHRAGTNGPRWVTTFNPVTKRWSKVESMAHGRYYPGMVGLADGSAIAVSGTPASGGNDEVRQVERYEPSSGSWSALPRSANISGENYPRLLLLGDGRVVRAGPDQDTRLFDPRASDWSYVGRFNYGGRLEGAAVVLPGLRRVLAVGGSRTFALPAPTPIGSSTNTAEVIDFSHENPRWRYTGSMNRPRMNANLVLTPDGKALAVGGGLGGIYGPPVLESELYNPRTGSWTLMDAQRAPRDYHSTALLLPDGRVLSAGQDMGLTETTIEYFSPPYLFRGPRPRISRTPKAVDRGQRFTIRTPDASDISRVALVKPGTATHSVNFDQRYVNLDFSSHPGVIRAKVPRAASRVPPGYYMLFILDSEGVPGVAKFVHVG